jgi:hypothetical protein
MPEEFVTMLLTLLSKKRFTISSNSSKTAVLRLQRPRSLYSPKYFFQAFLLISALIYMAYGIEKFFVFFRVAIITGTIAICPV